MYVVFILIVEVGQGFKVNVEGNLLRYCSAFQWSSPHNLYLSRQILDL